MCYIVYFRLRDGEVLEDKVFEEYLTSLTTEVTVSEGVVQKVLANLPKGASNLGYYRYVFYLTSV